MTRWPVICPRLDADSVPQQVIASDAAGRLGLTTRRIQQDLRATVARYSTESLLYFDPKRQGVPTNLTVDPYEAWYYALTNAYFCARQAMPLPVRPSGRAQLRCSADSRRHRGWVICIPTGKKRTSSTSSISARTIR